MKPPKKKFTIDDAAKFYKKNTKKASTPGVQNSTQRMSDKFETRVPKKPKAMGMTYGSSKQLPGGKSTGTTKYSL